jgi:hypothetical protein
MIPAFLQLGEIKHADPVRHVYTVSIAGIGKTVVAIAAAPFSFDRRGGVKSLTTYLPGTFVLLVEFSDSASKVLDNQNTLNTALYVIIGALAYYPLVGIERDSGTQEDDFPRDLLATGTPFPYDKNALFETVQNHDPVPGRLISDRSYNRPLDLSAGSWGVGNSLGGILLLSDILLEMGVAPDCRWLMHYLDGLAELQARQIVMGTEAVRREFLLRAANSLLIQGTAATRLEGLGGLGGAIYKATKEQTSYELLDPNLAGFFRRFKLEGGDVEGSWDVLQTVDPTAVADGRHKWNTPHVGLFSEQRRQDGTWRVCSAREIRFEKTPDIRVPEERRDWRSAERTQDQPPLKTEADTAKAVLGDQGTPAQLREVLYLMYGRAADYEELNVFFRGLRQETWTAENGIWTLPPAAEVFQRATGATAWPELPIAAADEAEYDPTSQQATRELDTGAGQKTRLFKNSSVFLMEEDGGVVIGDGTGCEIRMKNGRLTLAGALSVEVLPGRDFVVQAGRHAVVRARDRVEFTSTRASVAIKAQQNLHLLSGNGSSGATIIENRAEVEPWHKVQLRQIGFAGAYGSGIVLKSKNGPLGLLAPDHYIGGVSDRSNSPVGTDASCDVVINAGTKGSLLGIAGYSYLLGHEVAGVGSNNNVAGVFVARDTTYLVNSNQYLVGNYVGIDRMTRTAITMPKLGVGGVQRTQVSQAFSSVSCSIYGGLGVDGDLQVARSAAVGGSVAAKDGCNSEALAGAARNAFKVDLGASAEKAIGSGVSQAYGPTVTALEKLLGYGLGTDYGQAIAGVAFPSSKRGYNVNPAKWVLPETRWQYMLGHGAAWEESIVEHDILGQTLPYPGLEAYRKKTFRTVSAEGKIENRPLSEYYINAES